MEADKVKDIEMFVRSAAEILGEEPDFAQAEERIKALPGSTNELARSVVTFLPLAFARALFSGTALVFPDTYIVKTDNRLQSYPFSENEIFKVSTEIARDTMMAWSAEATTRVAMESAEFNCINQALNAGLSLEDINSMSPPVVWGV
jgi:hypothetical protein